LGRTWIKDTYFTGGATYCDGGNPPIGATDLDVIYHCERYGALTYAIPVPAAAGTYDVVLHFAEILYVQAEATSW
jgi:Malectin domain